MVFKQKIGSRAQVMHGTAKMTGGGLQKKDLKYNKHGKIVSKKLSAIAKKENRLQKAGWTTIEGQFGAMQIGGATSISPYSYLNEGLLLYRGNTYESGVKPREGPTFFTKDRNIADKYGEFIGVYVLNKEVKLLLLSFDTKSHVINLLKQAENTGSPNDKIYANLLKNLLRVFFGMADNHNELYNSIKNLIYIIRNLINPDIYPSKDEISESLINSTKNYIDSHKSLLRECIQDMVQYYGRRYGDYEQLCKILLNSLNDLRVKLRSNRSINPSRYSIRKFDHLIITIFINLNESTAIEDLKFDGFEYIQSKYENRRLYNLNNRTNVPDEICIFFPNNRVTYFRTDIKGRQRNNNNMSHPNAKRRKTR